MLQEENDVRDVAALIQKAGRKAVDELGGLDIRRRRPIIAPVYVTLASQESSYVAGQVWGHHWR